MIIIMRFLRCITFNGNLLRPPVVRVVLLVVATILMSKLLHSSNFRVVSSFLLIIFPIFPSSIPEWDDSVQDNGELFFIKCSPVVNDSSLNDDTTGKSIENVTKANKISTFLRKRKAKKRAKKVSIGTPIRIDEKVHSIQVSS